MLIIKLILLLLQRESCFFNSTRLVALFLDKRLADLPKVFEKSSLPYKLYVKAVFEQLEINCGFLNSNFLAVLVGQVVLVNNFQQSAANTQSLVRWKYNEL
jgi:hypothetical protein